MIAVQARLLLQGVGSGRVRRFDLEREMHPFMPAVLLGVAGRNALEPNPES